MSATMRGRLLNFARFLVLQDVQDGISTCELFGHIFSVTHSSFHTYAVDLGCASSEPSNMRKIVEKCLNLKGQLPSWNFLILSFESQASISAFRVKDDSDLLSRFNSSI